MSGRKLLFDSNIVIYLSNNVLNETSFTRQNDIPFVSVITYMEVFGYDFSSLKEKNVSKIFLRIQKYCILISG